MRPLRVVLDTNVLVSALLFSQGRLSWLRIEWQRRHLVPLASRATVLEILRVLAYPKFRLSEQEREQLLGDSLSWCDVVDVPDTVATPDCRDPDDLKFLALAIAGAADALVTGDDDLLAVEVEAFRIVSPAALRDWLDP